MSCSKHPEATACAACIEERVSIIEADLGQMFEALAADAQAPSGPAEELARTLAASRERVRAARKGGQ